VTHRRTYFLAEPASRIETPHDGEPIPGGPLYYPYRSISSASSSSSSAEPLKVRPQHLLRVVLADEPMPIRRYGSEGATQTSLLFHAALIKKCSISEADVAAQNTKQLREDMHTSALQESTKWGGVPIRSSLSRSICRRPKAEHLETPTVRPNSLVTLKYRTGGALAFYQHRDDDHQRKGEHQKDAHG
jgi:hypothetical protein